VQDPAPPRDAVGIVLGADARLLPHCCYAVRRSPRTRSLRGTTPLSHHSKKRNRCGRYSEQPCSATIDVCRQPRRPAQTRLFTDRAPRKCDTVPGRSQDESTRDCGGNCRSPHTVLGGSHHALCGAGGSMRRRLCKPRVLRELSAFGGGVSHGERVRKSHAAPPRPSGPEHGAGADSGGSARAPSG
jgi:hypothetical protein